DFCYTGNFTERGIKGVHGYMTEYVVDDEKYMNVVPPSLRDVAVLLEPLTITEKAVLEACTIQNRLPAEKPLTRDSLARTCRKALVLGAGPVGFLAAMTFVNIGIRTWVVARHPKPNSKADLLARIGADYLATSTQSPQDMAGAIGDVDLILEATGAAQASFDFLQILGTNGMFIFTGVPAPLKDITLDAGTLMRHLVLKNQVALGTVNAPRQAFQNGIRDLSDFMAKWPQPLQSLITDRVPLDQIDSVVSGRQKEDIKTVLDVSPVSALAFGMPASA
ncbi:MAG TPA: zinc-binding dehydrogenase, partial [Elusimicrobiota bacterium]|nr:zinc-binding dehydrogenase [Elusimicrobiota bacterium]